ncbi:uncharacterized protein LOC114523729 [Dendronephthya gigantea]|uniref:uncharacterized protein LOC114523729 n=1 Tax=Dendronephthya gigantea TaxID=151771 RepID=UPI00106DC5A1|nr:uncharacterized protein LOC114523729 [Dendronephthya gigantea]
MRQDFKMAAWRRFVFIIGTLVTVQCQYYYYDDYFPEESKFQKLKGDNYESPVYVEDVEKPHYWIRLRDRSQRLLDAFGRRGYNPNRRQTTYEGSYQNSPRRSNIQRSDWQTYTDTRNYVKGPRINTQNGVGTSEHHVHPQETVQVTARRYDDARTNYVDRQDRRRKKNQKKRKNRKKSSTEYSRPSRNTIRRDNRQRYRARSTQAPTTTGSAQGYQGCIDTGMYCTFWKSIGCCEEDLGRKFCKKTCGFCSPRQMLCPSSYKYGCCYDGREALDFFKSSCPKCRDKSRICRKPVIYRDCDPHSKNTLATRRLCPVTCGACYDYSTSER